MASVIVTATASGSAAKQSSRSAETGMSTARVRSPEWASTSSRVIAPSRRPRVTAKPPLVVAMAAQPMEAKRRAEPSSHALGMKSGVPGTWRARRVSAFSDCEVVVVMSAPYRCGATAGSAGGCRGHVGLGILRKLPILHLARHREDVADVDGVDLHHALIVHVQVDQFQAVVLLPERLGARLDALQVVERVDREAIVIHARALHGIVLGDEEDELVPVHTTEDQPAAILGHDRHFLEAEHLFEEGADVRTAFLAE